MPKLRTGSVKWIGASFRAREKREMKDSPGNFIMVALEHHPRVAEGQLFRAKASEVTWDAATEEGQE
jgi:hypothetical protein